MEASDAERLASSGSATPSAPAEPDRSTLAFIHHKVSKLDTLAGLAIRYKVSVADIKRSNGLLSDTALYARDILLIPNQQLPIGEEIQKVCAQVLTGVGRDQVLNSLMTAQPASAALARIATTLNVVNSASYPKDVPVSDALLAMYACGNFDLATAGSGGVDGAAGSEVEMTERSSEGPYYTPPASSTTTRLQEAVRRRRVLDDRRSVSDSAEDYGWGNLPTSSKAVDGYAPSGAGAAPADTRLGAWFSDLGKAIGDSVQQTVQKVKEAANQPALARTNPAGFGRAADGVLSSLKGGGGSPPVSYRKPNATLGRAPFDASAAAAAAQRVSGKGKAD